MRIAEEATRKHCEVSIDRCDNHHVHANGRNGSIFVVRAYFGLNHGWKISEFKSKSTIVVLQLLPIEDTPNATDTQEDEGDTDQGDKDGDGDDTGSDEDDNSTQSKDKGKKEKAGKKRKMRSPIKSRWMVPLIKQAIKQRPNMSNKECCQLVSPYMREVFFFLVMQTNDAA
jgi:hypothetical protein